MAEAVRDQNNVPSLLGVSSVDLTTPTRIAANPTTKALLIDSTSLYAGLDTRYQPLDSDLTTIAGLTATTDNFLVSVSSAWASRTPSQVRTTLGLVIGTDVQAYDADLTTWAGITPAAGIGTFLATPSSANLLAAVTDETGSGSLVFATSPTLVTPVLGVATATSLAVPTITTASGALTITPASGSNLNITLATTGDFAINTDDLYVDTSTGQVGIGTTAPGAKLDIASGDIRINRGQNIGSYVANHTNFGSVSTSFGNYIGGTFTGMSVATTWDGTYDDEIVQFSTHDGGVSAGIRMTIDKSGNVGIGTTAPGAKLHILGSNQNTLALDSTTNPEMTLRVSGTIKSYDAIATSAGGYFTGSILNSRIFYSVSDVFQFGGASGSYMTINAGNVGIGTTANVVGKFEVVNNGTTANFRSADTNYNSIRFDTPTGSAQQVYVDYAGTATDKALILGTYANRANQLTLATSGNVGIGTTNPAYKLETLGGTTWSGTFTAAAHFIQDKTNYRGIGIGYDTSSQTGVIAADTAGAASNIAFWTYNSGWGERVRIQGDGNVGIGTTSPQAPLNTYKTPTAGFVEQIRVGGTDNYRSMDLGTWGAYDSYLSTYGNDLHILSGRGVSTENHNIKFYTGSIANGVAESNQRMIIQYDGNVGIGTTAPGKKVEINSATGDCLRLTYNDADGSAVNYTDFAVSSSGDLTITPSGGDLFISGAGSTVIGSQSALATTATTGFVYIPTSAGTPTGVPTTYTGKVAMEYDTTANKLWVYNGAWKSVTLA